MSIWKYLLLQPWYAGSESLIQYATGRMAYFVVSVMLLIVLLLALPDGTEAEVDLRLYKNAENETKLLAENKLASWLFFFDIPS